MISKKATGILTAFILGASAGGAAALLLAPASGKDSRKKVRETLERAKRKTLEELGQVKEFALTRKGALKEALHEGNHAYRKALRKVPITPESDLARVLETGEGL